MTLARKSQRFTSGASCADCVKAALGRGIVAGLPGRASTVKKGFGIVRGLLQHRVENLDGRVVLLVLHQHNTQIQLRGQVIRRDAEDALVQRQVALPPGLVSHGCRRRDADQQDRDQPPQPYSVRATRFRGTSDVMAAAAAMHSPMVGMYR